MRNVIKKLFMSDIAKQCRECGSEFVLSEWEQKFIGRMGFGLPSLCPDHRLRRRLARRNERKLYKDKCDLSGRDIISLYAPGSEYKVYAQDVWWSDKWDPRDYGRDYDFGRPFFEQFYELQKEVPRLSLMNMKGENSEFCNATASNKNCYLVFGGDFNEDCINSIFCMHTQDCVDTYWIDYCQLCFDVIDCTKCYSCKYSQNCHNCKDSHFLYECRGCSDCFMCVGLVSKQYYIFNKQYSKEEYEAKLRGFGLSSRDNVSKLKGEFAEYKLKFPHRHAHIINCENVSGNNLVNAKNCESCFDVTGPAEDLKDIFMGGFGLKDSVSSDHLGHGVELFYEILGSAGGFNCAFCSFPWYSNDIFYSDMMVNNCSNCFGCSNMRKAKYCILNKQYSQEEYEELKVRIIEHMKSTGEWGEYFPMEISPFAYNETVAQDVFELSREEVEAAGLKWHEEERREVGTGPEIPDEITDASDDILSKTFICEKTGRPFRINEKELRFYRRNEIPLPAYAPETRNEMRLAMRNTYFVWERKCDKCGVEVKSAFEPGRAERIYCEKCYLKEVY